MKAAIHLSRRDILITILLACVWFPVFVLYPVLTYNDGSSRNIRVEVVKSPYKDSPTLQYRWTGDVYRSCAISLRRKVVDANDMVYMLETSDFTPVPVDQLGVTSFIATVTVSSGLAEGPATYQVTEVPRCTWLQRLWPVAIEYPPVEFELIMSDDDT